jgi:hypothetical protein
MNMRVWIGSAFSAVLASEAAAGITTFAEQAFPPGLPFGTVAYDLRINVFGNDDWTSTSLIASVASGASYLDPNPLMSAYTPGVNEADSWGAPRRTRPRSDLQSRWRFRRSQSRRHGLTSETRGTARTRSVDS